MEKNNETLHVLRHSTSHIMAQAVQALFPGARLAIGPSTDTGFYYDFDLTDGHAFTEDDLIKIEEKMKEIIKQNLTFEKYFVEDVDAKIAEFKKQGEIYKAELLEEHRNDNPTLYLTKNKDGKVLFNDLCAGPHIPYSSFIKPNAFKLLKVAGAYWRGSEKNKMLQRIYATVFWTKEDLADYLNFLEEAEKRDHRKLGTALDLFSTREEVGGGLVLWHPNLAVVREEVENYWRNEHRKRGYVIVNTPHIAKSKLWDISGHTGHYRDNMFFIHEDDEEYVLKPMNCPFHIMIYQSNRYSYRSLPLRMAELGTVYRKEKSGALSGLTRVQGFTQDDAHVFCTPEQLVEEINKIIDFVADTMAIFNMEFDVELSTRPEENYVGTIQNWDLAEAGLKEAMDKRKMKYEINEGDGAFYGPKIDFKVKDAIGRTWQCATIQLDFNLPERFELKYQDKDGQLKTPVMLHRVIFGSMERFHGLLIEHYAGAFPTWLAPTQVCLVPISNEKHADFAQKIYEKLNNEGIRVKLDDRSESMNYKIREALQDKKIPYVAVIGDKEIEANSLAIRARGKGQIGVFEIDDFVKKLSEEIKSKGKKIVE
ncbi:MAG TPA: threonine--tRNA ligase [Candidatus Gastranaerophilaceae bacterium]|nr:threonine--tRNA ligase [Candidatus Gastranaerophilaceae bacterium]HPT41080.1 threonine--tRNA ligase [Candidatus Gastranaerophilaceae bacterium]